MCIRDRIGGGQGKFRHHRTCAQQGDQAVHQMCIRDRLNLGLRDVGALAAVLSRAARRGEDIGAADVLERYQAWRRFDSTTLALGMDSVNRLFSNNNPVLRLGRDLGLGLVNAVPGLRRGFMRQAAGLSGDLPKLLAGQVI